MRRVLCLLSEHDDIKEKCIQLDNIAKEAKERMAFIQKQAENAREIFENKSNSVWVDIKKILEYKNMLPDGYDHNEHALQFDLDENSMEMFSPEDSGKDGLKELISRLLK